jgi:chorismate lyase
MSSITPWVTHKGSITDKLKALATNTHLLVLNNIWEQTDEWDHKNLCLSPNIEVLHRDILMWAEQQPCWYARTILPKSVYHTEKALFDGLKTKALGDRSHNHPHISRTHIIPYTIHTNMSEFNFLKKALKHNTPTNTLWGRISTFTIHTQFDFYLLEIFLPGILRYCHEP